MYCAPENKFLTLVFFNGGNALHTKYTKMVFELINFLKKIGCKEDEIQVNAPFYQRPAIEPPHDNAKRGGRSRGGRSDKPSRKVIRGGVSPAEYSNDNDRYKGPNTAFILLESSNIRKRLMCLQTIAVSKTLTFHAFAPSTTQRPWTVCLLFATTTKTDTYIRAGIRWAIRKAIRDDRAILDKITEYSGTMGTAQQRAQHFINTIELYYAGYQATKEGQKCGVWVLYAAPFATGDTYTEIDLREQRVRTMISRLRFQFGATDIWGEVTKCTRCKLMEHQTFECIFQTENTWKGPKDGVGKTLSDLKDAKREDRAFMAKD
ncbi:hypothetical protein F5890DRAFT_1559807 [Lentinula detonsa]|uniref:Uncharacterized protein n=1 Tax=Lentinula detonsa TaxID=2804962 RepID=A0AA38UMH1_9AGAR|nr:hypothetical protein F5890DRAFT_1559807 [Lentinula detonsa]